MSEIDQAIARLEKALGDSPRGGPILHFEIKLAGRSAETMHATVAIIRTSTRIEYCSCPDCRAVAAGYQAAGRTPPHNSLCRRD